MKGAEARVGSADSAGLGSLCHEQLDVKIVIVNEQDLFARIRKHNCIYSKGTIAESRDICSFAGGGTS